MSDWLPELTKLNDHGGAWDNYLEACYSIFREGFVGQKLEFHGKRVGLKCHPIEEGKEATFWHMASEGSVEAERKIDLRRLERIAWPRAIIDNGPDTCFVMWTEYRNGEPRIHLWCEEESYLFVVSDRGEYVLPWTAYYVEYANARRKLNKRAEEALAKEKAAAANPKKA